MTEAMCLLAVLAWPASGVASTYWWWTTEHDLRMIDAIVLGLVGIVAGPFAFAFGWMIHGKHEDDAVLIRRRGGRD